MLVIRVGGGYMIIDEFVATYAEQEMQRLEKLYEKGIDPHEEIIDLDLKASPGMSKDF
jgi:hypothetical protein